MEEGGESSLVGAPLTFTLSPTSTHTHTHTHTHPLSYNQSDSSDESDQEVVQSSKVMRPRRGCGPNDRQGQPHGHVRNDDEGYEGSEEEGAVRRGRRREGKADAAGESFQLVQICMCMYILYMFLQ